MMLEPFRPLREEKPDQVQPSFRMRMTRSLNMIAAGMVVVAMGLGALLLFTHYLPQSGRNHSVINPLPALTQPPTLLNHQYGDDPSDHDIPTFALDQSVVYATDGLHSIYALQASTGLQLRRISMSDIPGWSVLANSGVLYTIANPPQNGFNSIEAWNTSNGSLLWSRKLWGSAWGASVVMGASPPLVLADGVIYVCASPGGGDFKIYAIHASDGAPLWSHDLNTGMLPQPLDRIIVVNGVIYVSSSGNALTALRAKDGSVLWNDGPGGVNSLPTVANGSMYVSINTQVDLGPHLDEFAAVSAATGKVLWHYTLDSGPVGSAVVVGNTVYIGSDENKVYAFDANSGMLKWSREMDQLHALPRSDDRNVFVGSVTAHTVLVGSEDGYVIALQADTGAFRWYYQSNGLYTAPTIAQGGVAYMQSDYPDTAVIAMSALDIQSGQLLWNTSLGKYVGPTDAATPTSGITPHLPGIPSFTVEDVRQYLKTHTFSDLNTTGTPTITFTNYKSALGLVGITEGVPGEASAPNPMDKELVCIVIWKSTYYDQTRQKEMENTGYVIFSANTGVMIGGGSSGGPT
ncbi:MAG: PQQ-binding-like beta-propeller repeat protein [Chloroflexota bacterium]|nr:PQQ-binding-like beta-propeller repeat protein [Chloroflexota bacterium]